LTQATLNLGILAHVDAGKTTLTERLLYAAGVIDEVGSVDAGTTRTDSLALEQQRGITIKSAVVSFAIGGLTVNLIDTPGHPDFIAEVERVLSVLDGAVLVISAVEGVQPQTPLLMRALQRLGVPTILFVNKLDRLGADSERTLAQIRDRLSPSAVAMWWDDAALLEALAEHDESLLEAYVADKELSTGRLREALAEQTARAILHPVFRGSAITGDGVEPLMAGIADLLPSSAGGGDDGPVSGAVFKIERGPAGDRIAYVRMLSGALRTRDTVRFGNDGEGKVTALAVFDDGTAVQRDAVCAGEIAKVWGLREVRIGDMVGDSAGRAVRREFPPPTLESVVAPLDPDDGRELRLALEQLAEQDPLIGVRQDGHELSVSLYGEVQKEVIQATLASDYGLDVDFRETTPIYIERPARTGEAVEELNAESNPFNAGIGLRVAPARPGSGVEFRLDVDHRGMPLYAYKTAGAFEESMAEYVREALRSGRLGWQVTDCVVTMTECAYAVPDGPPSRRGPLSKPADFRKLTPLVVASALERAGTVVCEPTVRVSLDVPTGTLGAVLPALIRLGGTVGTPTPSGRVSTVDALLSAGRADELQRQLPGLTNGEGVFESSFAGYEPVAGDPPRRSLEGLAE
jgi:ribosomal protection tetracycline resistance protein